ncbi:SigB/SigF/SigG family RNA polymerase sigma factor [Actinoplanes sp. NBRC 103695]|uniref:SigB/SigF/SigG family RNA polymerase sigma factor n=1 Tax=Actinoplanes sp. NBRC 103695 TaxID=3032202 RepID=UPI00255601D9|nr:SigB/SigF/SigG family RNA polymerase sigma factor [Actinoplanes sp. NBRC 103695]
MRTSTEQARAGADELIKAMAALPVDDPRRDRLRAEAIEAWVPLARHLAARYHGRGEPADDLLQTATVGLIKAVDRFDPTRGIEFAGFAIPTVLGEIKRHFRDRTWSVRVPRRTQELRMAISNANNALLATLGRSPTVADVAKHLGITEEEVLEGLEGARAYSASSLDAPVTGGDGTVALGDTIGEADHEFELAELRMTLGRVMASLTEREQRILSLRFYGNMTQAEIAARIGLSQMHVSRLIARALEKLRADLRKD